MDNRYPLPDEEAVKGSPDSFAPAWTQLKQPFAHRARVRHPQIWPMLQEQLDQLGIVGKNLCRPALNRFQDARVELLNGVRHERTLAQV